MKGRETVKETVTKIMALAELEVEASKQYVMLSALGREHNTNVMDRDRRDALTKANILAKERRRLARTLPTKRLRMKYAG